MTSYDGSLPVFRAEVDCAVRVNATVMRFSKGQMLDQPQGNLKKGRSVAVALESLEPAGNVKRRPLAYLFEPISTHLTNNETNR